VAKSKTDDPLSFPFGALAPKKKAAGGAKKGKRKLTPAQRYTAQFYMKPRRR
jgi:hypothetical protein